MSNYEKEERINITIFNLLKLDSELKKLSVHMDHTLCILKYVWMFIVC